MDERDSTCAAPDAWELDGVGDVEEVATSAVTEGDSPPDVGVHPITAGIAEEVAVLVPVIGQPSEEGVDCSGTG